MDEERIIMLFFEGHTKKWLASMVETSPEMDLKGSEAMNYVEEAIVKYYKQEQDRVKSYQK